jgi:hypothetical protein
MLKGKKVWTPPGEVRNLRALLASQEKLVRLSTIVKNRLHSLKHRNHLILPENPFSLEQSPL